MNNVNKMMKKMFAVISAAILLIGTLSIQVRALSPVHSPGLIDGAYAHGSTSLSSNYVSGTTSHDKTSVKQVQMTGYYTKKDGSYATVSAQNSTYGLSPATVSRWLPSDGDHYYGCISEHWVFADNGASWHDTSSLPNTP